MSFIQTTSPTEAEGDVLAMYQRQQAAYGFVPNYAPIFCHRPEVLARWGRLLAEIRRPVDERRFELVTFAVAYELSHSSCSLAHGPALAKLIGNDAIIAIAKNKPTDKITDAEIAMMEFARKIAKDALKITPEDIEQLRKVHGFLDEDIFDIVAIAAGRCFFTKLLDALGSEPDLDFMKIGRRLRRALNVGRPISYRPPESVQLPQVVNE